MHGNFMNLERNKQYLLHKFILIILRIPSGIRIPLYHFSSQCLLDDSPFEGLSCIPEEEQSILDSLLLAQVQTKADKNLSTYCVLAIILVLLIILFQWEDRLWKGVLRYDVTTSEIKVGYAAPIFL